MGDHPIVPMSAADDHIANTSQIRDKNLHNRRVGSYGAQMVQLWTYIPPESMLSDNNGHSMMMKNSIIAIASPVLRMSRVQLNWTKNGSTLDAGSNAGSNHDISALGSWTDSDGSLASPFQIQRSCTCWMWAEFIHVRSITHLIPIWPTALFTLHWLASSEGGRQGSVCKPVTTKVTAKAMGLTNLDMLSPCCGLYRSVASWRRLICRTALMFIHICHWWPDFVLIHSSFLSLQLWNKGVGL